MRFAPGSTLIAGSGRDVIDRDGLTIRQDDGANTFTDMRRMFDARTHAGRSHPAGDVANPMASAARYGITPR